MEVSEDFLGPEVHAAFARKAMGKLNHGDALRPEKEYERDDPEPDSYATIGGDGGNDVEVKNGDNKKQNEVPSPQHPAQVRDVLCCWRSNRGLDRQISSPPRFAARDCR